MVSPIKAVGKHCFECCGDAYSEVNFCTITDCQLWPFRLGCKPHSPSYHKRITEAWERGGPVVEEMLREGKNMVDFLPHSLKTNKRGRKPRKPISGAGGK